jgi:hypothetical protein
MATDGGLPAGLHEIEPTGYIGIDFGTSNSHLAYCNSEGSLTAEPIRLGGKASQCTCVLWKEPALAEHDVIAYGTQALQEWSRRGPDKRKGCRFAAGFKPDIATSERARLDARAFLRKAFLGVEKSGAVRAVGAAFGMPVVIGVPAEISDEQKRITAQLAEEAGFGHVACVAEPLGALAFHLSKNDITAAEARDGVVVVDFGGGTLDVALVNAKGLREPWGDPALGGRLFDDLFYQWLRDQNPGLTVAPHDELFMWQVKCQELKENFSQRWAELGETDDFTQDVLVGRDVFTLRDASTAEFRRRAAAYTPSPVAKAHFRDVGGSVAGLGDGGPIDLFAWVRRTLAAGRCLHLLDPGRTRVVLTGGSSGWPFMKDLACEVFLVPKDRLVGSAQPEITVGSGLAIFHVLKRRFEKRCVRLREETEERKKAFETAARARAAAAARDIARAVVDGLRPRVEAVFLDWRANGGSLNGVVQKVEAVCKDFEAEVEALVKDKAEALTRDLWRLLRDHLRHWLTAHEIEREVNQFLPEEPVAAPSSAGAGTGAVKQIAGELALGITGTVTGVVVVVVGIIKFKLLVATFIAHPLAGIVALLASVTAFKWLNTLVENQVKTHNWGSWPGKMDLKTMQLVLSERRLKDKLAPGWAEAAAALPGEIDKALDKLVVQVAADFDEVIGQVIEDLGVLEQFKGSGRK